MKGVFSRLSRAAAWLNRLGWTVILIAHATGAAAWWWLMPGGFPTGHPRFWMNQVLPFVVLLGMLIARSPCPRKPWASDLRFSIKAALATFWIVISVALVINFHLTFQWKFLFPLLIGGVMALSLIRERRGAERLLPNWNAVLPVFGFFLGALVPTWQRALPPATIPRPDMSVPAGTRGPRTATSLRIDDHTTLSTRKGAVQVSSGTMLLEIEPLLNFTSISRDGCWSIFAPNSGEMWTPNVQGFLHQPGKSAMLYTFMPNVQGRMEVLSDDGSGRNQISAASVLRDVVWSHLNSYTQMSVAGHKRLYLSFSPCPEERIEVMPSDYPFGRPARFAYLDDAGMFHVVEASSAEKGPFKDLAKGKLPRGDALSITFFDEDRPVYQVMLKDWSRQCSTQLSPTAGWGVPENSIEFALEGNSSDAPASIFVTLAATSVGRGFDTVGHKPGTYLNNMIVERLTAIATTSPQ